MRAVTAAAEAIGGNAAPGTPEVFVCSDDTEARVTILNLVADIDADGVDAGPLTMARYTEPAGMLLVQLAYAQGLGPR